MIKNSEVNPAAALGQDGGNILGHLKRLDVLRALAVLIVLGHHIYYYEFLYRNLAKVDWQGDWLTITMDKTHWASAFRFLNFGHVGVILFFVISGYCIHLSFLKWSLQRRSGFWPGYYVRRFFRIYPAYFVVLMVLVISHPTDRPQWLSHLFLVQNMDSDTFFGINPSFWSLAVEWQLYLVYPLFLRLLSIATMEKMLLGLLLLHLSVSLMPLSGFLQSNLIQQLPWMYWFTWGLGAWAAERAFNQHPKVRHGCSLSVLFFALALFMSLYRHSPPLATSFFALSFAFVCDWYLRSTRKLGWLERLLIPIGIVSYSIYLIHQPLIGQVLPRVRGHLAGDRPWLTIPLGGMIVLFIAAVLAAMLYFLVERPGNVLGHRLAKALPSMQ